ncbi:MAG: DUF4091 domain-containing protein [Oscillospiraceae bacterium]|jgi:hypothetical protein|nr:DUF4091 domain-containing protein [Oscillospiraceae bacterium]
MNLNINTKLISSLEKVFPNSEPAALPRPVKFSLLKDDIAAFQLAVRVEPEFFLARLDAEITVDSPLADLISIRRVDLSPVRLAAINPSDGDYISDQPGMYPDLLRPAEDGKFHIMCRQWNSFWIEVESTPDTKAGSYPVVFTVTGTVPFANEKVSVTISTEVTIVNAILPKQTLKRTEWFHADCIADYYHVEPLSEEHWQLVEEQVKLAGRRGINMLLTPIFTPPLDTAVGGERTTMQLMDVTVEKGVYAFGFDNLRRWIEMGQRCGIEYFEMAHLYTQWGAAHCPKIMATVDGEYKRIFGWEDDSNGARYRGFLNAMLPALTKFLEEMGLKDKTVFHISDEPTSAHLELYKEVRDQVADLLKGWVVMDALSDYRYYTEGVCELPVVATNHVTPFLEGKRPEEFWVYYCVSQGYEVSNRFMAMPSYRNRIIAEQLYKYQVKGFLQWGYNFYNSQYSLKHLDPFANTDSDGGFPAGDAFAVYPGDGGKPWSSIRLEVFWEAMCDLRAFNLLESLAGRDFVMGLIESEGEVTFFEYPRNADYHLKLRRRVNEEIAKRI